MIAENPYPFIAGNSFHHTARDIGIGTGGLDGKAPAHEPIPGRRTAGGRHCADAHAPSTSCSRAATSSSASSSITSGGRSRITVGPAGSASTPRAMSASM